MPRRQITRLISTSPCPAQRPVALLDATELRKWRDAARSVAPASVNRVITIEAVLNLAAARDEQLSTAPEIG